MTYQFIDLVWIGFNIAQNFCQSIVYWNIVKFFTNNDIPITVVLTGSMLPAFQRGDIMGVITKKEKPIVGDIGVYQQDTRPVPIVHRFIEHHQIFNKEKQIVEDAYISKGDANAEPDYWLYDYGYRYLKLRNIKGVLCGNSPAIGFMTIAFKENIYFQIYFYSMVILCGLLGYAEG